MRPNPYEAPNINRDAPPAAPVASGTSLLFAVGGMAMLCALFLQNVTLAGGSYWNVLLLAIALTVLANACLAIVVWRGPDAWRLMALVVMVPTLFVVFNCIRRASSIF